MALRNESKSFVQGMKIGNGAFGTVYRYKYQGHNEAIQRVAERAGGYVAVKKFDTGNVDANEVSNVNHLNKPDPAYPLAMEYQQKTTGNTWIISELVSYGVTKDGTPMSADLQNFLERFALNADFSQRQAPNILQTFFHDAVGIFATDLYHTQKRLHENNMLHLDTSARNFLVTMDKEGELHLKISDVGLSVVSPNLQSINFTGQQAPIRWVDNDFVRTRAASIHTDLFAMKATMMEMVGLLAGKTSTEILSYAGQDKVLFQNTVHDVNRLPNGDFEINGLIGTASPGQKDEILVGNQVARILDGSLLNDLMQIKMADTVKDEDVLQKYYSNVESAILQLAQNDSRREPLQIFMSTFKSYLTQMPGKLDPAKVIAFDEWAFLECKKQYAAQCADKITVTRDRSNNVFEQPHQMQPHEVLSNKKSDQMAAMPNADKKKEIKPNVFSKLTRTMSQVFNRSIVRNPSKPDPTPATPLNSSIDQEKAKRDKLREAYKKHSHSYASSTSKITSAIKKGKIEDEGSKESEGEKTTFRHK